MAAPNHPLPVRTPGTGVPGVPAVIVTYPSAAIPPLPLAAGADQLVTHGDSILRFLYSHPTPPAGGAQAALKQLWERESNFEEVNRVIYPKDRVNGPLGARAVDANYNADVNNIQNNLYVRSVFVSQRSWAATHGGVGAQKPYLRTDGVVLCMAVIIYDPVSHVGLMAHVDEDQDSTTIVAALQQVFPGNSQLQVFFYGEDQG